MSTGIEWAQATCLSGDEVVGRAVEDEDVVIDSHSEARGSDLSHARLAAHWFIIQPTTDRGFHHV